VARNERKEGENAGTITMCRRRYHARYDGDRRRRYMISI
jgi:hypothetical protein